MLLAFSGFPFVAGDGVSDVASVGTDWSLGSLVVSSLSMLLELPFRFSWVKFDHLISSHNVYYPS